MLAAMMYVARNDPALCYDPSLSIVTRKRPHPAYDDADARAIEELKQMLLKTHPKYFHFSFIDLRKVTTPPVQIPSEYRSSTATATLVSGRIVPLTRDMWMRRERQRPRKLATIAEENEEAAER